MNIGGTPSLLVQLLAHIGGGQLEGFIEVFLQSLLLLGFFKLMLCDGMVIAEPKLEIVRSDCLFNIFEAPLLVVVDRLKLWGLWRVL